MAYLEEWSLLDKDHSNSMQVAIEALKASTLRLPVVGGVTVCSPCTSYTSAGIESEFVIICHFVINRPIFKE